MKRRILWIISLSWAIYALESNAELSPNSKIKPDQVEKILERTTEIVVRKHGEEHAADFSLLGYSGKVTSYPNYPDSTFAWIFNGLHLYSDIGAFNPEIVVLDDCKPAFDTAMPTAHCDWIRYAFNVCHLFMFNANNLKMESVTRLKITRDTKLLEGLPRCDSIQAMAVAKIVPDAMLITLG